jgi:hypothetical protein
VLRPRDCACAGGSTARPPTVSATAAALARPNRSVRPGTPSQSPPPDGPADGARLAHGFPRDSESAAKGITKRQNPESQTARKPTPNPGFLANSNTCSGQITATYQSLPNSSRTTS